ncbi:protein-glutamate methylesterase/protein-glutamine glutaminase [Sporosalibacterium faouarense]|uniref:protein-glutamate methylesterase/protein-glutamine glutaminase n=1 Tax=Sporosalibacterium faouarense TaxID=516123 RepID=UPI00141CD926|nr:chemotaxis response regulator protein-glutamate methylesterase [Sporosalibacterium faouarense]MTI48012.1 chemotaxis response regulator protein-glutamate methylesterase [Bacillota bacterium]
MAIKVFVVDDSAFMRRIISDILSLDEEIEVIGTGKNGKDALEQLKVIKPDIVTLDVEMPVMDGIETLREIMSNYEIPVVMLSSITVEGAEATLKALELGAIDFITKPSSIFDMDSDSKKTELIDKIKGIAKVKIPPKAPTKKPAKIPERKSTRRSIFNRSKSTGFIKRDEKVANLIAIGTSTGGPRALQSVIPYFNKNINGSILVVQHMPPGFTKSLANRLDGLSQVTVKEAEHGEEIIKGWCYIAPGDHHMKVEKKGNKLYIKLTQDSVVSGHRPSVDVLMDSVADITSVNIYGVILTGMGGDGAKGMKKIRNNRGYTIAQNEETCVIYGMPKVAVNLGAIEEILSLDKIAPHLNKKVGV